MANVERSAPDGVLRQLALEAAPLEPEQTRRFRDVAAALGQDAVDVLPLHARQRRHFERWLGLGVSCVKVKVGLDPETDAARVKAVREVAGRDVPVTIDANCGGRWRRPGTAFVNSAT